MIDNWEKIWNKTLRVEKKNLSIQDLLVLNGFDSSGYNVNEREFIEFILYASNQAGFKNGDTIFEIGCGCGAILKILEIYAKLTIVGGIDFSKPLCEIAKNQFPSAIFENIDAIYFNQKSIANHVISHSVFQYFRDLEYAKIVLKKMLDATQKSLIILDIPDVILENDCIEEPKSIIGHEKYAERYSNLHRQFYSKQFFVDFATENNLIIEFIEDKIRKEYMNAKFNFHIILHLI